MKPTPSIIVYRAVDDVPLNRRFLAQFAVSGMTEPKDGSEPKEVMKFLPILFNGPTEDAVAARAEAFWQEEQRKVEARKAPRKPKEASDVAA
jgi:hypothetical protein